MTRSDAAAINSTIASLCPGVMDCALSNDSAVDCETSLYPIEFVNSITLSGVPDHVVNLKKGAPYLITHNTSPVLCNGTRVVYHRRVGKCLEVQICAGKFTPPPPPPPPPPPSPPPPSRLTFAA
jgi:hypothetical protein